VVALFNCSSGLNINVQNFNSFSSVSTPTLINSNGQFQNSNFVYQPGQACSIVVVQIMYQWPIFVNLLGLNLADLSNNSHLLIATAAFRTEPYDGSSCSTSF
jgi:hypothetical protein